MFQSTYRAPACTRAFFTVVQVKYNVSVESQENLVCVGDMYIVPPMDL